jgi:hypothetical protein
MHSYFVTFTAARNGAGCGDKSRLDTQPNCISTLSPAQVAILDPAGVGFNQAVLSLIETRYPEANDLTQGDGVNTGGYLFTTSVPDIQSTYVGRVDYNLTPTQRLFGRVTITRRTAIEGLPEFPTDPVTHPFTDNSYGYVASHVWTIGQNKVNSRIGRCGSPRSFTTSMRRKRCARLISA